MQTVFFTTGLLINFLKQSLNTTQRFKLLPQSLKALLAKVEMVLPPWYLGNAGRRFAAPNLLMVQCLSANCTCGICHPTSTLPLQAYLFPLALLVSDDHPRSVANSQGPPPCCQCPWLQPHTQLSFRPGQVLHMHQKPPKIKANSCTALSKSSSAGKTKQRDRVRLEHTAGRAHSKPGLSREM